MMCAVVGCRRKPKVESLCRKHYRRINREVERDLAQRVPPPPRLPDERRDVDWY